MAKKKSPKIESYEAASTELNEIVEALESEEVSIDDLSNKVERATQLLNYCRTKLRSTEEQVADTIKDLDL